MESTPTHDGKHGSCVYAKDNAELSAIIGNASNGDTILLCPGRVTFNDEIVLTKSITIKCDGPKASCVFDGKEKNRHLSSTAADLTLVFVGIAFVNGFVDEDNDSGTFDSNALGGSVLLDPPEGSGGSTIIFSDSLFYNNRALAKSSTSAAVSIILYM